MVLFAGISAEALVYGEADGGENDENLFRSISVLLDRSNFYFILKSIDNISKICKIINTLVTKQKG